MQAAPVEGPKARTSVSEAINHRFENGEPGGVGYKVTHEVLDEMSPGEEFPSIRIDPAEHPDAFEGQWADSGFHAAWISPRGEFQYEPNAYTIEGAYFDNSIAPDGASLAPGDSVDIAVKQLAGDAPLTWDTPRGDANGEMRWEVATHGQTVHATYGEETKSMDVVFIRADLVARGGDFDARDESVRLPSLVVDLPKTYGPDTRAATAVSQFAPYLHYIRGVEGTVLPQSGKAVFTASTRGYLPEAKEHTLPGGTHVREWHIPLNIVVTLTSSSGLLDGRAISHLPAGGVVWTFDESGNRRIEVPEQGSVITGNGLLPEVTTATGTTQDPEPASDAQDRPAASGTLMDDIVATGSIDRTLGAPTSIAVGKRTYGLTLDPDLDGRGTLAIRSFSHLRTAQRFFETVALPYVTVDGETVALDRSRLVDLRVVPLLDWIRIGFWSRTDGSVLESTSYVRAREGRIFRPGVVVEAVYDLGDGRYAFFVAQAMQDAGGNGDIVQTFLDIRSLSGAPAHVSAVHYMELAEPGPVAYEGEVMTTEFSAPTRTITMPRSRLLSGATGGGRLTVVRAGAPITSEPSADPTVSIEGAPVAVYVTSTEGSSSGRYTSAMIPWLNDVSSSREIDVGPIDEPCVEPPVVDDDVDDAPETLDIERAWFDFDGVNLLTTVQVARLEESVVGSPATFRSSWRSEHIGWGLQAERDAAGSWAFRIGLHPSSGIPWNPINSVPVTGELSFGAPGYIRMSSPIDFQFAGAGFLDGEMLRDTGATSFDMEGVVDHAPRGATDDAFGRGEDYLISICPGRILPTVLELAPTSDVTGQHTDRATLRARLTDDTGAAVPDQSVSFRLGDLRATGVTDVAGVADATFVLDMPAGTYPVELSFAGAERYQPSSASGEFVVEKEDTALELTVSGRGSNRVLRAVLTDADSPDAGVAGRTVAFFADGDLIGSEATGADGVAIMEVPPRYRGAKTLFEARFEGDDSFLPSSSAGRS